MRSNVVPSDATAHNVYVENEVPLIFIYEQDASKIMCLGTRQTNWGRVGLWVNKGAIRNCNIGLFLAPCTVTKALSQ